MNFILFIIFIAPVKLFSSSLWLCALAGNPCWPLTVWRQFISFFYKYKCLITSSLYASSSQILVLRRIRRKYQEDSLNEKILWFHVTKKIELWCTMKNTVLYFRKLNLNHDFYIYSSLATPNHTLSMLWSVLSFKIYMASINI